MRSKYDIDGLAMEFGFDLSTMAELYSEFISEMHEELNDIEKFLSEDNREMVKRTVHNIKGVTANLNIHDIYQEALIFDSLLKKDYFDDADTRLKKLNNILNDAEIEIRKYFEEKGIKLNS